MRCCAKALATVLVTLLSLTTPAQAKNFRVVDVTAAVRGDAVDFRAALELPLSEEAAEAVDKGIAVNLAVDITLLRERPWMWDRNIGEWQLRAELRYHRLSGHYLVRVSGGADAAGGVVVATGDGAAGGGGDADAAAVQTFPTLIAALAHLGDGMGALLPLAPGVRPDFTAHRYRFKVKAVVLLDMLPAPLRLWAYVAPSWRMASRTTSWPLAP